MAVLGWQVFSESSASDAASAPCSSLTAIDLVIHEAGHVFALIRRASSIFSGGPALQVILPAVCALTFFTSGTSPPAP